MEETPKGRTLRGTKEQQKFCYTIDGDSSYDTEVLTCHSTGKVSISVPDNELIDIVSLVKSFGGEVTFDGRYADGTHDIEVLFGDGNESKDIEQFFE